MRGLAFLQLLRKGAVCCRHVSTVRGQLGVRLLKAFKLLARFFSAVSA